MLTLQKDEKTRLIDNNRTKIEQIVKLSPDIEISEDELCADLCRESFFDFVKEFWGEIIDEDPVWNWHIEFLCKEFQRIAERVFSGLPLDADTTVNISPGTTKSTIISIMFPAWIWTRMPSARIVNASYAHDIAMDMASKSRDVITSDKYRRLFPEIQIRDDTNAKANYVNTLKGQRYACGTGGQIMGKHFHFIIVDDPLNAEQAASEAELTRANRWMERTLPSRKVNKKITPTILIMQRLHENDPTGARLARAEAGMPHNHICLPAELGDNVKPEYCRDYYVDGLMDPIRLDAEVLQRVEQEQGEFVLASQYGQTPIPEGTAMFHIGKIRADKPPAKYVRVCRAWDKAGTEGGGAFTVGTLMGIDDAGTYWIVDVIRVQYDSGRRERLIRSTAEKDGKHVVIAIEQEPGSGGKHSAQSSVKNLAGFTVKIVPVGKSDGDKIARADPFSTQVNNGNVCIVEADWNKVWRNELRYFPFSKFKDQVDSAALAFNVLSNRKRKLGGGGLLRKAR